MALAEGIRYRLTINSRETGQVAAFVVNEAVAEPYQVNLLVTFSEPHDNIIGQQARFDLVYPSEKKGPDRLRTFHGRVFAYMSLGHTSDAQHFLYSISIKPRLAKAAWLSGNETYVDLTPAGIIAQILNEIGLQEGKDYDLSFIKQGETGASPKYAKHMCKLKYEETHLDFLH